MRSSETPLKLVNTLSETRTGYFPITIYLTYVNAERIFWGFMLYIFS